MSANFLRERLEDLIPNWYFHEGTLTFKEKYKELFTDAFLLQSSVSVCLLKNEGKDKGLINEINNLLSFKEELSTASVNELVIMLGEFSSLNVLRLRHLLSDIVDPESQMNYANVILRRHGLDSKLDLEELRMSQVFPSEGVDTLVTLIVSCGLLSFQLLEALRSRDDIVLA